MIVSALCDMEIHVREKNEREADQLPLKKWYTFEVPKGYVEAFQKATTDKDKMMVLQASLKHKTIENILKLDDEVTEGRKFRVYCRTLVVQDYKIGEHKTEDEEPLSTDSDKETPKETEQAPTLKKKKSGSKGRTV